MSSFEAASPREIRRISARIKPGNDLFEATREICRHYGITCATVDSAIGSMTSATLVCISKDPSSPSGASYKEPVDVEGPLELLPTTGTIGIEEEDLSIHLHGSVATDEQNCFFGHFVDSGKNTVLATIEIHLTELIGINWIRRFDEETGFPLFRPEENQ